LAPRGFNKLRPSADWNWVWDWVWVTQASIQLKALFASEIKKGQVGYRVIENQKPTAESSGAACGQQVSVKYISRSQGGSGADPSGPNLAALPIHAKSRREWPESAAKFMDLSGWQLSGSGIFEKSHGTEE
jgi:hypothetical protein